MNNDMHELLKKLENVEPSEDLKARVLKNLLTDETMKLSHFQRLLFISPIRAACIVSVASSGAIWAIFGNGYTSFLSGLFMR